MRVVVEVAALQDETEPLPRAGRLLALQLERARLHPIKNKKIRNIKGIVLCAYLVPLLVAEFVVEEAVGLQRLDHVGRLLEPHGVLQPDQRLQALHVLPPHHTTREQSLFVNSVPEGE